MYEACEFDVGDVPGCAEDAFEVPDCFGSAVARLAISIWLGILDRKGVVDDATYADG
jgi:hypothetical protein